MIIETALVELAKAGGTELFISSSESLLKKVKTAKDIKQLFINTGEFFVDYENDADQLFDDMANVLSKENMTKLANELKDEPGYKLKDRLLNSLMGIMKEYEIPHGMALSYANAILFAIMGQLPVVAPDKYDRAYQAEWKAEQEECFKELAEKFERLRNELQIYQSRQLEILSADAIDLDIRRQTTDPKIGFDFFNVDDDTFKEALESKKNDEVIAIKARCKEEAIYCTINELWMQGENRPIFIVKNEEDWKSLLQIKDAGNIYIPWFYSDQIVTIPNNTNIFVFTERVPSFIKGEITLRPRTYSTISASLQRAGMGINEANKLVSETHGLFIPLKKKLFNGAYLKEPRWINGLQRNIKETALLIGQWTDCDGDKAVIESLSGIKYQDFISEIKEYAKDEDPFIHIVDINSTKEYYLANVTVSATFKEKAIAGNKKIEVSQVSINKDLWGSDWEFTFKNAEDYVSAITDVKVNGTSWEEKSYSVSSGGQYYKNTSSNKLVCAAREYSANPTIPVLKSGDIAGVAVRKRK